MNISAELITAIGAILIGLGGNILQFFLNRKKASTDFVTTLIESAMKLNKQELDTVRALNKDLEDKVKEQGTEIELIRKEQREEREEYRKALADKEIEIKMLKTSLEACQQSVARLEARLVERKE